MFIGVKNEWETLYETSSARTKEGLTEYYYFLVEYANHVNEKVSEAIDQFIINKCKYGLDKIVKIVTSVGKLDEFETYLKHMRERCELLITNIRY